MYKVSYKFSGGFEDVTDWLETIEECKADIQAVLDDGYGLDEFDYEIFSEHRDGLGFYDVIEYHSRKDV